MGRLLVVGATGALGREVVAAALARQLAVRVLVRDPDKVPRAWRDRVEVVVGDRAAAMRGIERVFSCAGASVMPGLGRGWRGYGAVDTRLNRALIDAAQDAGVRRFIYVSVHHGAAMARVPYIAAHERVVDALRASRLDWAVVRPTGFFSAVGVYLDLAGKGAIPELGDGRVRTNPIADDDLARVCVDAIGSDERALEIAAGGPDVLSRRELGDLAFAALGRAPRYRHVPLWLARTGAWLLRPVHPRMSQVTSFLAALAAHDVIAPARGTRRLIDHFAARAHEPTAA